MKSAAIVKRMIPTLTTFDGIVTDSSPRQPANAPPLMHVTLDGMTSDLSPSWHSNARDSMHVTPEGIVTSPFTPASRNRPSFEQSIPFLELNAGLFGSTENDISPPHPVNAFSPMLVTVAGIETDISPLHPSKVLSSIRVTPNGIVTDLSLPHL